MSRTLEGQLKALMRRGATETDPRVKAIRRILASQEPEPGVVRVRRAIPFSRVRRGNDNKQSR